MKTLTLNTLEIVHLQTSITRDISWLKKQARKSKRVKYFSETIKEKEALLAKIKNTFHEERIYYDSNVAS